MTASVAIVILNWNNFDDTIECVRSITEYNKSNVNIIVVDNNSSDDSLGKLKNSLESEIFLLESSVNGGFGHGNNIGIQFALSLNTEFIWLLNNDTLIEGNTLARLIEKMADNSGIGVLGSKIFYNDRRDSIQCYGGGPVDKLLLKSSMFQASVNDSELEFITGTSMFIRSDILKEIFGFRSDYFMYWEDVDMSLEIQKHGWKLGVAGDSIVYHKESASFKGKNLNPKKAEFFLESCIVFSKYNSPAPYFSMVASTLPRIILYGVKGQKERLSAGIKGVLKGLKKINAQY